MVSAIARLTLFARAIIAYLHIGRLFIPATSEDDSRDVVGLRAQGLYRRTLQAISNALSNLQAEAKVKRVIRKRCSVKLHNVFRVNRFSQCSSNGFIKRRAAWSWLRLAFLKRRA